MPGAVEGSDGGEKTYVESVVEGGDEAKNVQEQTDGAAPDAQGHLVGDLVEGVALHLPGHAHADVRQANGAPDEEVRETRKGEEPGKDGAAVGRLADEGEQTKGNLNQDAPDGATMLIDVGEEARGHAALGHGLHGAGGAEGAAVGDGDDGDGDDGVEDGGQDLDAGVLDREHEGGGLCVGARGAHEARVVGGDNEAENKKVDDVEEGDAPKDLLAGHGDGLARVGRLGGGEADELCAAKGEGCNDEDTGEAVEACVRVALGETHQEGSTNRQT
ncbi:LOW QUALITY PROTEIN: hypothetical protein ColTof3_00977 [Colletotrichum tofieldiae]|nr:LOW QUALITY PROTEIN: hypothetical protein ColTof3_00977 [Colletotrichum tofieldiae]